jgi:hypothetical protein
MPEEARKSFARAEAAVETRLKRLHTPELRRKYLALPHVAEIQKTQASTEAKPPTPLPARSEHAS